MLKKLFFKYGHVIRSFAFLFATISVNNCPMFLHDPKIPESAKKFRKF